MILLFSYNWQVRNEWFDWCGMLTADELLQQHTGGVGSILQTLFHIIDAEYSWIRALTGESDLMPSFENYKSLEQIRELSDSYHEEIKAFLNEWTVDMDGMAVKASWSEGMYTHGEILRHLIAHEIHHMGQISVWAKQLGKQAVNANFIGRGLTGLMGMECRL